MIVYQIFTTDWLDDDQIKALEVELNVKGKEFVPFEYEATHYVQTEYWGKLEEYLQHMAASSASIFSFDFYHFSLVNGMTRFYRTLGGGMTATWIIAEAYQV